MTLEPWKQMYRLELEPRLTEQHLELIRQALVYRTRGKDLLEEIERSLMLRFRKEAETEKQP